MALSKMSNDIDGKSDLYKYSHYKQYPVGTRFVESYLEFRNGAKYKQVVPYGLQYILEEYFTGRRLTKDGILRRKVKVDAMMGEGIYNLQGWLDMLEAHDGNIPIRIKAIPEGTVLGTSNAMFVVENTDPRFPWITNFCETALMKLWYPSSVSSGQFARRQMFLSFLYKTGTPESIDYRWVDFGYRGVASEEAAALGGSAHLLSFRSSDTMIADDFVEAYYPDMTGAPHKVKMNSVPASEHSTMTAWGRDNEAGAVGNMLTAYPKGVVSIVGDSYDYENFVRVIIGGKYRDDILRREGVVVVRPDSGDPASMVLHSCQWLDENFGSEVNDKGYKVLNKHVRVIQGDGINYDSAYEILATLERSGWSADNITLGEGGGALQVVNRDTERVALKACAVNIDGIWHDVFKNPKTDSSKASKAGHLAVVCVNGVYRTITKREDLVYTEDCLVPVFENGKILKRYSFDDIRARVIANDITES
jgi:nicotinamide phosphoribosyltransferase